MALTPSEEAKLVTSAVMLPAGGATTPCVLQTYDRRLALSAAVAPTSGTLTMTGIWLTAGQVVNGITFVSGATGETGGTNLWYALYTGSLVLMAQSTNDTGATSFAANTAFRKALTAPQTCTTTGLYYLGFLCTQSAGGVPTLLNITSGVTNNLGSITGMTPILCGTSTTGLTSSAPANAAALTTVANCYYAFID